MCSKLQTANKNLDNYNNMKEATDENQSLGDTVIQLYIVVYQQTFRGAKPLLQQLEQLSH